jgi:hypothetical protein
VDTLNEFVPIYPPAVLIGAVLVAVFAFRDFHVPYDRLTLRYAVSFRRYVLATAVYVGANIILFLLLAGVVQYLLVLVQHYTGIFGNEDVQPHGIRQISLALSILLVVVSPNLPVTRRPFTQLRGFAHELALYPKSFQLLMTILGSAPFTPRPGTSEQLEEGLARYSVPRGTLRTMISPSAMQPLEEAWSLRNCFSEIARSPTFSGFLEARDATASRLEVELQKVLRRVAKALTSLDRAESKQLRVVSQFLAEDCERLVEGYRSLLAEAVISCESEPGSREKLIESFGYTVSLPQTLPFLPIVVVFGLDFVLLLWPLIVSPWVAISTPFPRFNIFAFALAHAISQTAAVAWAIFPKVVYDFARPLPGKLPMLSYVAFGAFSFLTGVLVWTGLRLLIKPIPGLPLAQYPVSFILLNSLSFLFMTVCMSVLIDIRLRAPSYDYRSKRWRDAVVLALTLLGAALIFQAVFLPHMPPILREGWQPTIYLGLVLALGLVFGFFVPSVAAAYLQADEIIAKQIPSEVDFLAQVKRRKLIDGPASDPKTAQGGP